MAAGARLPSPQLRQGAQIEDAEHVQALVEHKRPPASTAAPTASHKPLRRARTLLLRAAERGDNLGDHHRRLLRLLEPLRRRRA